MEKLTLKLPALYADHHVSEVRRILLAMPGVDDVYASSAFRLVEVTYDPAKVQEDAITAALDQAGYLGDLLVPEEMGPATKANGHTLSFRHTASSAQTGKVVGFTQATPATGRPLWPCPGMGPLQQHPEDEE